MGWQIIREPSPDADRSPLYCVFSSVVDDVIWYNCTRADITEVYTEELGKRGAERLPRIFDDLAAGRRPYAQFTKTFDEMIEWIGVVHGAQQAREVRAMIDGTEDPEEVASE